MIKMSLSSKFSVIGCNVCALLLPLVLVCVASAQVAVEYGIIGSKSAPSSKIGKALEGRFKDLSEQAAPPSSVKQVSKPQVSQQQLEASPPKTTDPNKPNKFTTYSSEGVKEITIEPSSQDTEREK